MLFLFLTLSASTNLPHSVFNAIASIYTDINFMKIYLPHENKKEKRKNVHKSEENAKKMK